MTRPRMLLVAPSSDLYGSDRALLSALPELAEAFDVTLAVPAPGPVIARAEALGATTVVLGDYAVRRRHLKPAAVGPWLGRLAVTAGRLSRLHRSRRFDLVYSNTLVTGIGPVVARLWRVPHLLHVHECPTGPEWFVRSTLRAALGSSDLVVANSAATRAFLLSHQPALTDRVIVVHNGIELPEPGPPPPPSDALRVTLVGRIHPKKGHLALVAAAELLARTSSVELELHLFGDTLPEHEELRQDLVRRVEAAGMADRVFWHGFVDDTAAMYRDCDVAVVPSVVPEEFSLVCVEAQSMRLPVVVTGPGGASEVVVDGDTGLVVPPDDVAALAAALAELAADPVRRAEMGRRGRERMVAHFSRRPFGERMCAVSLATAARAPVPDHPGGPWPS